MAQDNAQIPVGNDNNDRRAILDAYGIDMIHKFYAVDDEVHFSVEIGYQYGLITIWAVSALVLMQDIDEITQDNVSEIWWEKYRYVSEIVHMHMEMDRDENNQIEYVVYADGAWPDNVERRMQGFVVNYRITEERMAFAVNAFPFLFEQQANPPIAG